MSCIRINPIPQFIRVLPLRRRLLCVANWLVFDEFLFTLLNGSVFVLCANIFLILCLGKHGRISYALLSSGMFVT